MRIALILGLATRYVVALLLLFVIMATLSSHRHWEFAEAAARPRQNLDQRMAKLENFSVAHGVSFLRWRSGGVEHPHDTPP